MSPIPQQAAILYTIPSWLPTDASAHGPALDHHLLLNLWLFLALATLAHLILLIGLIASRTVEPRNLWRVEYLPLAILTILFATLTIKAERLWAAARYTGASPAALQVEVTGMQFAWYFRYPGPDAIFGITRPQLVAPGEGNPLGIDPTDPHSADDTVTSELVLPSNREIDLRLRAQDVIHGFSIPELRLKQNAVPGQTIHIHFTPTTPGTYAILCTQLCGLGHYRMNATLRIVPPDEFATWLAEKQKAAKP
ncbi:cytochrome c oxidase subunit 2 [Edaphobacter aggregans]|uniref:Cytochrome c oxidase subunit 2 n=1 Tax=Edaphobacter aggregans TaxID=570835 RepID=A0A428MCZ9_9BACT|nr:cupredoxin domain-containing protein [Edaphobacter aggregans]RSL14739.1 cytochrome c oxidase subunit 2 [Edaphobacter aggregans]